MERDRKKVQYLPLLVNGELVYLRKKKKSDREARVDAAKLDALERLPYRACTL